MSGGHFDHKQFRIREIADKIKRDIAWALQPKPDKVHADYWVIDKMDSYCSYYIYPIIAPSLNLMKRPKTYYMPFIIATMTTILMM